MHKPQIFVNQTAVSQAKSKRVIRNNKQAKTNKRRKILSRDEGNLDKTNTGTPLFAKLTEKETNIKT